MHAFFARSESDFGPTCPAVLASLQNFNPESDMFDLSISVQNFKISRSSHPEDHQLASRKPDIVALLPCARDKGLNGFATAIHFILDFPACSKSDSWIPIIAIS